MKIITFPPVGLTAWELTEEDNTARSVGLLSGRAIVSSNGRPARRLATAHITSIGADRAGAGYVESLRRLLRGGNFVRINCASALWWNYRTGGAISPVLLDWVQGGDDVTFTYGGQDVQWTDGGALTGEPTTKGGFPALTVSGFAAGQVASYPDELIKCGGQYARAVTMVTANKSGVATIKLHDAITESGLVSVGTKESIVFEATSQGRTVQSTGSASFVWEFREVLPAEYAGATEVNPW